MTTQYERSDNYVGRLPSPPRMTIPPPLFSANPSFWPDVPTLAMPSYLKPYNWTDVAKYGEPENNWQYSDRRKAQPIAPFIFLGPLSAAKDINFLSDTGMTMILSLRQLNPHGPRIMSNTMNTARALGVHVEDFAVPSLQYLRAILPRVVNLIQEHLVSAPTNFHRLGRVMVVCENGNGTSAAVLVAFLISVFHFDLVKAVQIVQAQRFSVNIDDEMKNMLLNFIDVVQAQQMIGAAVSMQDSAHDMSSLPTSSSKRGRDDQMDAVMQEDDDDEARFGGRTFVPFSD